MASRFLLNPVLLVFGRRVTVVLVALLSVLTFVSCNRDPMPRAMRHLQNGDTYFEEKKYPEAILEYRIAVSLVDIATSAHYKLAEAYVKNDELLKAIPEYVRAADLDPAQDDLQVKVGNLLLIAGRFADARARARAVLQRNPKSVPAIILLGNSVVGLKDYEHAAELGRKAIELDPDRPGTYGNLAVVEMLRGNAGSAEQAFQRAIELAPQSPRGYIALANLYRSAGAFTKAEQTLKQALDYQPDDPVLNSAVAGLYAEWGRSTEAEPYLINAAEHSADPNAKLIVGDYYLAMGRVADSKRILEKVAASDRDAFVPATTRLAVIEYASGKRDEGHKLLDAALAKEPQNSIALAMKSRLLLSDNRVEEALNMANAAVNADQRVPEAHIALGRVYLVRQQRDKARKAFNEALALRPSSIEPQLELAKLHLQRGEIDTAIDFATQGIKQSPHSLEAQLMIVRAMAARADDKGQAEAALKKVMTTFPKAPAVYNMAGALALNKKDTKSARAAWEHALQLDPNDAEALGGIAALYAGDRKPAEGWVRVDARITAAPRNPDLLMLGAKIRMIQNDARGAEELLRRCLEVDASNLGAYNLLGRLYVSQRRPEEARRQYMQMLRQEPSSVAVHTMLGLLAEAQKDTKEATAWYQKALQLNPRAAVAANNLAWINVSANTDLDAAVRLAEIARGEKPTQAEFHDTLGWAYYKKRMIANAIESLQRAVQLNGKNPTYHYHLGMAYIQEGTDPKARAALEQALKLNPNFKEASEARETLKSLVY